MMEELKAGLFTRMEDQLTEIRASIPQMIRELAPTNQLPQQLPTIPNNFYSSSTHQLPPQMMSHMIPNMMPQQQMYQASSY